MNNFNNIFLASNSMNGFYSFFDDFRDAKNGWYNYIIKGGPGTGKSTAMKYIANQLQKLGEEIIVGPCSSDPDSLDAVILPNQKIIITDGTAPHILEPKFVGATDRIVNFGDAFDFNYLISKREKIIETSEKISDIYKRVYRYTKVLGTLKLDIEKLCNNSVNTEKVMKHAKKLCDKYINKTDKNSYHKGCFLSALTHKGIVEFTETINNLSDKVVAIIDEYGVVSELMINEIIKHLNSSGYSFYIGYSPILPTKPQHIIIPELKLSFVTVSSEFKYDLPCKKIYSSKFIDAEKLEQNKEKISFNQHAISQIEEKTILIMKEAKLQHDFLEKLYSPAVDFKKINQITYDILDDIKSKLV